MAVYIINNMQQLYAVMEHMLNDYAQDLKIHVCKLAHRDIDCSEFAQYLHDGQHPSMSVFYVAGHLESAARIIVKEMLDHFPEPGDHNDDDFIMTCPACGVHFSQQ